MRKQEIIKLKIENSELESKIKDLKEELNRQIADCEELEQVNSELNEQLKNYADYARARESLIKTKFLGKLYDQKLVDEFTAFKFGKDANVKFADACTLIKNFDFDMLQDFIDSLDIFEETQSTLDKYRPLTPTSTVDNNKIEICSTEKPKTISEAVKKSKAKSTTKKGEKNELN